jgi:uncharacterized membrane protein
MGLPLAALGLWYWLARGQRRAGLLIACAGFAWSVVALKVVVPAFRGAESVFYGHYESIGGSPEGIAKTAVTDPTAIVSALTSGHDFSYLFRLAAPLAGAFLLAPGLAAAALPQLLANGLSDRLRPVDPHAHYVAAVIPFLIAASVLGLGRLPSARRFRAVAVVAAVAVAMSLVFGPWPHAPAKQAVRYTEILPQTRVEALQRAISLVPADAAVTATNAAGSHLSARRYVYSAPVVGRATWAVVDKADTALAGTPAGQQPIDTPEQFVRHLRDDLRWEQVFGSDGVFVLRSGS